MLMIRLGSGTKPTRSGSGKVHVLALNYCFVRYMHGWKLFEVSLKDIQWFHTYKCRNAFWELRSLAWHPSIQHHLRKAATVWLRKLSKRLS